MSIKHEFIEKGIRRLTIKEYLKKKFESAGYSHTEMRRTPMGMRITVHADKVGLVIGRGGRTIDAVTETLEDDFNMENPRINVEEIDKPFLDANIVAEEIRNAIERGVSHRKICNIMLSRAMESGAVGCQIRIRGRTTGSIARTDKFQSGYLKHSGHYADELVDTATTEAITPLSSIGIKVKIMKEKPEADIEQLQQALEEPQLKEEEEEEELTCPVCGKEYEKTRSLKIHIGQRHPEAQTSAGEKTEPEEEEEPEGEEEEESEGIEGDKIAKILGGTVKEAKKMIREAEDPDLEALMEAEKEGKDRKTVKDYLEKQMEEE